LKKICQMIYDRLVIMMGHSTLDGKSSTHLFSMMFVLTFNDLNYSNLCHTTYLKPKMFPFCIPIFEKCKSYRLKLYGIYVHLVWNEQLLLHIIALRFLKNGHLTNQRGGRPISHKHTYPHSCLALVVVCL
jgi:hypothetical protein